jgi:hypothetical protein
LIRASRGQLVLGFWYLADFQEGRISLEPSRQSQVLTANYQLLNIFHARYESGSTSEFRARGLSPGKAKVVKDREGDASQLNRLIFVLLTTLALAIARSILPGRG